MSLYYCKRCIITHGDCGPWDDASEYFEKVFQVHKDHTGFQIGEPTNIETEASKFFNNHIDEWFHNLVAYYKPGKSCLIKNKWSNAV